MSRVLLLSVRPRFARALLDGTKTAEVRRRFPDVPAGMTAVIYSSSPEKAVVGTMRLRAMERTTADGIWREYSRQIALTKAELTNYLTGANECSILELEDPVAWPTPIGLQELRRILAVEPAQSFRYLTTRQLAKLEDLARPKTAEVIELSIPTAPEQLRALA